MDHSFFIGTPPPPIEILGNLRGRGSLKAVSKRVMHLSMLNCWGGGGRPDIGGGFELRSLFLFKCPATGNLSWVKKVQIPHTRFIIAGQKNSMNDQKSLPRADL